MMTKRQAPAAGREEPRARSGGRRLLGQNRSRGQVMVIFALSIFVFVGLCAVVIDVAWYWANTLRVQRAADAAALAGAVMLPNDVPDAVTRAAAEASKNGYAAGGGVTIRSCADNNKPAGCSGGGGNANQLNVTITAPVSTFFMRVFGINSITATRTSKAEYVLPVPMGSPQNYYGVGLLNMRSSDPQSRGFFAGTTTGSGSSWTTTANADATQNTSYAVSPAINNADTAAHRQAQWTSFFPSSGAGSIPTAPTGGSLTIDAITVRTRAFISGGTGNQSTCQLQAELSYNNGTSWTTAVLLPTPLPNTRPLDDVFQTFAPTTAPTATWGRTWSRTELTTTNFRVRLTVLQGAPTTNCNTDRKLSVDTLEVKVDYTVVGPIAPVDVHAPDGTLLAPQKFWGAMQSQGAPSVQGDAYMTGYATRKSATNGVYDPQGYYNYGVDINGGGGQVWIFDPGFCDTQPGNDASGTPTNQGTGENWTVGGSNGAATAKPVSAQYNLYNTNGTPYDTTDDTLVATSGSTFKRMNYTDPDVGGRAASSLGNPSPAPVDCGSQAWHYGWWALPGAQNLAQGKYRLNTTSRIYNAAIGSHPQSAVLDGADDQTDSTALNAFAIWTTNGGTTAPRVYGLGAMEAYFPLPGNQTSVFYLAQIESRYAGKWMDIDLWDPGDTGSLTAVLRFLAPDGGSGTVTSFYYNSSSGSVKPSNFDCGPTTSSLVSSITTSTGSGGIYNGKWLRVCIKLDDNYSAPIDPGSGEPGWWRISYQMSGVASGSPSTDLTTWEVNVRGNPVHLKVP